MATTAAREQYINHRYQVLRQLGAGAMGTVHLVADTLEDNQQVALKTIRGEFVNSFGFTAFKNEFQAMTTFHHPNVVEVYEFGTLARSQDDFFTMEYVEGRNLVQACRDARIETIYDYATQIGRALEYIHAQGFIHFDLKPDNIMVRHDGTVKVMDFGLVEPASTKQPNFLKGTVNYLAPEMIRGQKVDHRLDLYSLGALLFYVITGRTLFQGTTDQILHQHVHTEPDLDHGVKRPIPPAFRPLLLRLLAKDPNARPRSASEFLIELAKVTGHAQGPQVHELTESHVLGSRSVGRDAELARIKDHFRARVLTPVTGTPPLLLVTGTSGIGKSRLIRELRHHVQLHRVRFHQGASLQNCGQPYLPFAEILRALVRDILPDSGPVDLKDARQRGEGSSQGSSRDSIDSIEGRGQEPGADGAQGSEETVARTKVNEASGGMTPSMYETRVDPDAATTATLLRDRSAPAASNPGDGDASGPARTVVFGSSAPPRSPTSPGDSGAEAPTRTVVFGASAAPRPPIPGDDSAAAPARTLFFGAITLGDGKAQEPAPAPAPPAEVEEQPRSSLLLESILREHAAAVSRLIGDEEGLTPLVAEVPKFSRPELEKAWLLDSICRFLISVSQHQPLVLYFSDLQWADPLSIELLGQLGTALARASQESPGPAGILLCACYRQEEITGSPLEKLVPELLKDRVAEQISLKPLTAPDVARMLSSMLGPVESADAVAAVLVERTSGNPFFLEATIRDLLAEGSIARSGSTWRFKPEALNNASAAKTVAEVLDRTLAKLSDGERAAVQLLSIFNRPVNIPLLNAAGATDEKQLRQLLAELRKKRFIERGWGDGHHLYSLRQNQLREYVYERIDAARRTQLHLAAGTALEHRHGQSDRYLEDLAQHFHRAGSLEKAIHYARRAADQAKRLYDSKRAASLYLQAYEAQRLLGADLAVSIAEASSYSASEKHIDRLKQVLPVVEELSDTARLARIQNWMGRMYYALGKQRDAIQWFTQFMKTTEGTQDDMTRALPHAVLGRVSFFLARFEAARTHLEKSVKLMQGQLGAEEDISYSLGMCGSAYAYRGNLAHGLKLVDKSIELATRINHGSRRALGMVYKGIILTLHGQWAEGREWLDKGVELARQNGDVVGVGTGSSFRGLVALVEGDAARAVELCRFGRTHIANAGGTWTFTMIGAHLAEALLATGDPEAAQQAVKDTLPVIETGERWGESPLYLACGRINLARGKQVEARSWFERALAVAEGQQARPFEAKARLALGALLRELDDPRAGEQLERARKLFAALGMQWYRERTEAVFAGQPLGICP